MAYFANVASLSLCKKVQFLFFHLFQNKAVLISHKKQIKTRNDFVLKLQFSKTSTPSRKAKSCTTATLSKAQQLFVFKLYFCCCRQVSECTVSSTCWRDDRTLFGLCGNEFTCKEFRNRQGQNHSCSCSRSVAVCLILLSRKCSDIKSCWLELSCQQATCCRELSWQ